MILWFSKFVYKDYARYFDKSLVLSSKNLRKAGKAILFLYKTTVFLAKIAEGILKSWTHDFPEQQKEPHLNPQTDKQNISHI